MDVGTPYDSKRSVFDSRIDSFDNWSSCPCNETSTKSSLVVVTDQSSTLSDGLGQTLQKETHTLVADAVKSLPVNERDHALNDIHGVANIQEEGKEFIDELLNLLDFELEKIKIKRAYLIAKSISRNYVNSSKFRLKFLRAELFNAKNAAARIVRYFEAKLDVFGKEKLTKDITLSDLTEEDIFYMKAGFFHLCFEKDRSGRSILFTQSKLASDTSTETRRRVYFYNYGIASEDEVTQRKGAVYILFQLGQWTINPESAKKVHSLFRAMPLRVSAMHVCHDYRDPTIFSLRPFYYLIKSFLETKELGRMRVHCLSSLECMYTLMTFGIPRAIFGADGAISKALVVDSINKRLADENERALASRLYVPNRHDVLLGKGKRVQGSPGNRHFRELMETYRNEYEQGSRLQKADLTRRIFKEIKSLGGRFLKEGDSGWEEVDDEVAKKKISHDFRNFRR